MLNNVRTKWATAVITTLILLIAIISVMFSLYVVKAETQANVNVSDKCKQFTEEITLYDGSSDKVTEYENYINSRFEVGNKYNNNANISDEWIMNIVPKELFDSKATDYLYIGKTYGFYFNYNSGTDDYLIYILLHEDSDKISGQYYRKITPMYYEKYKYNSASGTASLNYVTNAVAKSNAKSSTQKYYEKYSSIKNVYLKDVNFTASLYNANNYNVGESRYEKTLDKGAYFYGNYYNFKGVSTQSGKLNFAEAIVKIALSYLPLGKNISVGDAMAIADCINGFTDHISALKTDYRDTVTNEDINLYLQILDNSATSQIAKYGNLIKHAATIFETKNNSDGVLLGIDNNCYAKNTYLVNYRNDDNKWNTKFIGNVKMKIVEEDEGLIGSKIREIADVETADAYEYNFDKGERTVAEEDESLSIYNMQGSSHGIKFVAPSSDMYELRILSEIDCEISNSKNNTININQYSIYLQAGEEIVFSVSRINKIEGEFLINLVIAFMPEDINIGDSKEVVIQPGETKIYGMNMGNKVGSFDFDIDSNYNLGLKMAFNSRKEEVHDVNYSGTSIIGSYYANHRGKYYILIHNNSVSTAKARIHLEDNVNVTLNEHASIDIIEDKVVILSSALTRNVKLSILNTLPIYLNIYNDNDEPIAWINDVNIKWVNFALEANRTYYIKFTHLSESHAIMEYVVEDNLTKLRFGNNDLYKKYTNDTLRFETADIAAEYIISSNDVNITFMDEQLNKVDALNGIYDLKDNAIYYAYVDGDMELYSINIDVVSTLETMGIFDDKAVFIKFIPSESLLYKLSTSGVNQSSWYDNNLTPCNNYLLVGNVYYLRILGDIRCEYIVEINKDLQKIELNTPKNLNPGYYYFVISIAGTYGLKTICQSGVISSITILDASDKALYVDICADKDEVSLVLNEGVYYLSLKATRNVPITIRIK